MKEHYFELIVDPKGEVELFSSILLEFTNNAIEEKDGILIIRSEDDLDDVSWAVDEFAKKLGLKISQSITKKDNEDWINRYKSSIKPLKISSFYIRPEWEERQKNLIDIIINPALAFGSGHHESTSSCIDVIDRYIKKDDEVLDVGCGSGILAICANKKGAKVDICDTDDLALACAEENFILNSAEFQTSWVGSVNKTEKEYDFVIANIIADIIVMINQDLKKSLKKSGYLILSGIIDKYFQKVADKFSDFEIVEDIQKGEWHTLVLKRK